MDPIRKRRKKLERKKNEKQTNTNCVDLLVEKLVLISSLFFCFLCSFVFKNFVITGLHLDVLRYTTPRQKENHKHSLVRSFL